MNERSAKLAKDYLDAEHRSILEQVLGGLREASEVRVRAAQRLRALNRLPAEAGFFLVACAIEDIADARSLDVFEKEYEDEWNEVCQRYGLDPDREYKVGPSHVLTLQRAIDDVEDRVRLEAYEEFGEHEMASLVQRDVDEYDRLREAGRQLFFGRAEPFA